MRGDLARLKLVFTEANINRKILEPEHIVQVPRRPARSRIARACSAHSSTSACVQLKFSEKTKQPWMSRIKLSKGCVARGCAEPAASTAPDCDNAHRASARSAFTAVRDGPKTAEARELVRRPPPCHFAPSPRPTRRA